MTDDTSWYGLAVHDLYNQRNAIRDRVAVRVTGRGWREAAREIEPEPERARNARDLLGARLARLLRQTARLPFLEPSGTIEVRSLSEDDPFWNTVNAANLHAATGNGWKLDEQPPPPVAVICQVPALRRELEPVNAATADAPTSLTASIVGPDDALPEHLSPGRRALEPVVIREAATNRHRLPVVELTQGAWTAQIPLPGQLIREVDNDTGEIYTESATHSLEEFIDRVRCFARWQQPE